MTCVYNDSAESIRYLAYLQDQSTPYLIPTLLMMSVFIAVGSVGNCLVLIVYSTKLARTALRTFIISMSVFDLLINILVIPGEMYELLHMWDFNMPRVCKLRRYFNCALIVGSFLVLVAIAITRYKMVCCPHKKRVTITQAKVVSVIIALVSLVVSIPNYITNRSQQRVTPNRQICGHFCQLDENYITTATWNDLLFLVSYVACTIVMIDSYVSIGQKVWTHKVAWKRRKCSRQDERDPVFGEPVSENTSSVQENNRVMCTPRPDLPSPRYQSSHHDNHHDNQSASSCAEVEYRNKTKTKSKLRISCKRDMSRAISLHQKATTNIEAGAANDLSRGDYSNARVPKRNFSKYFQKRHDQQRNNLSGSWTILTALSTKQPNNTPVVKQKNFLANTTIKRRSVFSKTSWMMATVSFVSIVGFVPLLALNLYKTVAPENYESLEGLPLALFHFFFRSYLLNSAINPIMFSVWDKTFRRECNKLLNCRKNNEHK